MKAGFLTSEFFVTVLVAVLAAYVVVDTSRPTSQVVAALVVAGLKAAWYVWKRTDLKLSAQEAQDVAPAPGPTP